MYDEYGEVIMEDDGYYYSPHGPEVFESDNTPLIGCVSSVLQQYQPHVTLQHCEFIISKSC